MPAVDLLEHLLRGHHAALLAQMARAVAQHHHHFGRLAGFAVQRAGPVEMAQRFVEAVLLAEQVGQVAAEVGQFAALRAALEQHRVARERSRSGVRLARHQIARDQHRHHRGEHAFVAEPLGAGDIGFELGQRRGGLAKPAQVVQRPGRVQALGLARREAAQALHQRFVDAAGVVDDVVLVQLEAHREFLGIAAGRHAQRRRLLEKAARLRDEGLRVGAARRLDQRGDGRGVVGGGHEMRRDARRLAGVGGQPARHRSVGPARDFARHRSERRFVDQVVRKAAVTQHLRGFEFAPGAGELHRRLGEHFLRQFDPEVGRGDGRHPRQHQRRRRELGQTPFDQLLHRLRPNQRVSADQRGQRAVGPGLLQHLQHEQRIAAGSAQQVLRHLGTAQLGKFQ